MQFIYEDDLEEFNSGHGALKGRRGKGREQEELQQGRQAVTGLWARLLGSPRFEDSDAASQNVPCVSAQDISYVFTTEAALPEHK